MKSTLYILFTIVVFTCSCKDTAIHSPLIGKWRVVGYSISSGGAPMYNTADKGSNQYIQFSENGIYRSNMYQNYGTYTLKDNNVVSITFDDSAPDYYTKYTYKTYNLVYSFKGDTLHMSPAGPVLCIEGCSTNYLRY